MTDTYYAECVYPDGQLRRTHVTTPDIDGWCHRQTTADLFPFEKIVGLVKCDDIFTCTHGFPRHVDDLAIEDWSATPEDYQPRHARRLVRDL